MSERTGEHEWDAATYHVISTPQLTWGLRVLLRLSLGGDEVVLDAGCGSGRLSAALLERLPRGRLIAVDRSANMLDEARKNLAHFGQRVTYVQAELTALVSPEPADVVFSNATFHWVLDHPALFRTLHGALRPGGRLHAQCGGAGNLVSIHGFAEEQRRSPRFARWFEGWQDPWEFATAEVTRERLLAAGFTDVETSHEDAPTPFDDAESYRRFVASVVLRLDLARLPEEAQKAAFLDEIVERASRTTPPFTLDYRRLNLSARRPEPAEIGPLAGTPR
jgi:trans-aconitate 2-methyltransferase